MEGSPQLKGWRRSLADRISQHNSVMAFFGVTVCTGRIVLVVVGRFHSEGTPKSRDD